MAKLFLDLFMMHKLKIRIFSIVYTRESKLQKVLLFLNIHWLFYLQPKPLTNSLLNKLIRIKIHEPTVPPE